jgi:hypothetical protein
MLAKNKQVNSFHPWLNGIDLEDIESNLPKAVFLESFDPVCLTESNSTVIASKPLSKNWIVANLVKLLSILPCAIHVNWGAGDWPQNGLAKVPPNLPLPDLTTWNNLIQGYQPTGTLIGEPDNWYPFMGTSQLVLFYGYQPTGSLLWVPANWFPCMGTSQLVPLYGYQPTVSLVWVPANWFPAYRADSFPYKSTSQPVLLIWGTSQLVPFLGNQLLTNTLVRVTANWYHYIRVPPPAIPICMPLFPVSIYG